MRLFGITSAAEFKEYVETPFQAEHQEAILEDWLESNPESIVEDGKLHIIKEGKNRKFVDQVAHLSFSAARSREIRQEVLYVTERAVFKLVKDGLQLIELAPGIHLEQQVLAMMAFQPIIRELRPMPLHLPERNS